MNTVVNKIDMKPAKMRATICPIGMLSSFDSILNTAWLEGERQRVLITDIEEQFDFSRKLMALKTFNICNIRLHECSRFVTRTGEMDMYITLDVLILSACQLTATQRTAGKLVIERYVYLVDLA